MFDWLTGIRARPISASVCEIHIAGYGPADVGPYDALRRHVGRGSMLDCHHIVEAEHLDVTWFSRGSAPAVAIPRAMHQKLVSSRFTAELGSLGGRHGGKTKVSKRELSELYRLVYTWHTPFRELNEIAQRVLR